MILEMGELDFSDGRNHFDDQKNGSVDGRNHFLDDRKWFRGWQK